MTGRIEILRAGPAMTVQDMGRSGTQRLGLSRGGAADRLALLEAAALLGLKSPIESIEMAGMGGRFSFDVPTHIALTGAPMRTTLDGQPLAWAATHLCPSGAVLDIGPAGCGVYGYLTVDRGIDVPEVMGSRATHLNAGIGRLLATGDLLDLGRHASAGAGGMVLDVENRFEGGMARVVEGPQTSLYSSAMVRQFSQTEFNRSSHGNRQGVRLDHDGAPFTADDQLGIVSDAIVPGDVQMTGAGVPFVLLPECQTTGGYPRIGTVVPEDLPRVAQAAPGAVLQFRFVSLDEYDRSRKSEAETLKGLRRQVRPRLRDPGDMGDLLSYQLISGATAGNDLD